MFIRLTLGLGAGIFVGMTTYGTDEPVGAAIAAVETRQIEGVSTALTEAIETIAVNKVVADTPAIISTLVPETVTLSPVAVTTTPPIADCRMA